MAVGHQEGLCRRYVASMVDCMQMGVKAVRRLPGGIGNISRSKRLKKVYMIDCITLWFKSLLGFPRALQEHCSECVCSLWGWNIGN